MFILTIFHLSSSQFQTQNLNFTKKMFHFPSLSTLEWIGILTAILPATYILGRYLPGATAFLTGSKLYTPTNFHYDETTIFDHTVFTWGTDYFLAVIMSVLGLRILAVPGNVNNSVLRIASSLPRLLLIHMLNL